MPSPVIEDGIFSLFYYFLTAHQEKILLVCDIGNTHIKIGLYRNQKLSNIWRLPSDLHKNRSEYSRLLADKLTEAGIDSDSVHHAAISSVVPDLTEKIVPILTDLLALNPLIITHKTDLGIEICVEHPETVGVDRLVNSVAALDICQTNAITIDFGSATTFDVVTKEGKFLGGVIAPGIKLSAEGLFQRASNLYEIPFEFPERVIGRNTTEAMQAGIMVGAVAMTEGIVRRLTQELNRETAILATGGLASLISDHTDCIQAVYPNLTLDGIRIIAARNL
jgi:type III pantothenate kinase